MSAELALPSIVLTVVAVIGTVDIFGIFWTNRNS